MRYSLLSFILIVFIFVSCEKQNEEFLYISVIPASQYEIKNSGELISFDITISSSATLSEFRIIEFQNNSDIDTLVSKEINGTNINEHLLYKTPNSSSNDTSMVKLLFYCKDINGKSAERAKTFYVVSSDILLLETTGNTMYSSSSTDFNAYDLLNGIPKYSTDSTSHINDYLDTTSEILSRKWVSLSALNFVKVNSFDYANATRQTVQNTYGSSLKKEFVDDIQADDIIITLIDNVYIAIKIIYVIDEVGVENDKYIFSIKK